MPDALEWWASFCRPGKLSQAGRWMLSLHHSSDAGRVWNVPPGQTQSNPRGKHCGDIWCKALLTLRAPSTTSQARRGGGIGMKDVFPGRAKLQPHKSSQQVGAVTGHMAQLQAGHHLLLTSTAVIKGWQPGERLLLLLADFQGSIRKAKLVN